MAQAILNPAIDNLESDSLLYNLYTKFYDGLTANNDADAPDYAENPPYEKNDDGTDKIDEYGAKVIDQAKIQEGLQQYSSIMTKNTAYMFANSIVSSILPDGDSGSGSGIGFVTRSGDSMQGNFSALYGFEAGQNNQKIFEVAIDEQGTSAAIVTGNLNVSGDVSFDGKVNISNSGIYSDSLRVLWCDEDTLNIASDSISMIGNVEVDGDVKVSDITIRDTGIYLGDNEYYHSGNSNKDTVDWSMNNADVSGNLSVHGTSVFSDSVDIDGGFTVSMFDKSVLYTDVVSNRDLDTGEVTNNVSIVFGADISLLKGYGVKLNGNRVLWSNDASSIVSVSAPNAILNLGDKGVASDGNEAHTQYIALQSDIKNYNGTQTLVSHDGTGNFQNGFSAGVANGMDTSTFQTYYSSADDFGVVVKDNMRFGNTSGPTVHEKDGKLTVGVPYSILDGDTQKFGTAEVSVDTIPSESILFNPTSNQAVLALRFNTDAKHFTFSAPIEASRYAVKSNTYKTQLEENVLFFDDGKFIEGVNGGLRLSQNTLFDGNLFSFNAGTSSVSFSSGFAGSGWAIMEDVSVGGVHATFDSLTIRKKMRVYELEVQKLSATNGSLWVSDSCSGDEVRLLN